MPLSLSNSIGFAQFRSLKVRELQEYLVKIFENRYFSDKNAFFGYQGVAKTFFKDQSGLYQSPPSVILEYSPKFSHLSPNIFTNFHFWGVQVPLLKIWYLQHQHPWRKMFSKLHTFWLIFQLSHSALLQRWKGSDPLCGVCHLGSREESGH